MVSIAVLCTINEVHVPLLHLYGTRTDIFISKKLALKTMHVDTNEKFNLNEIYSISKLSGDYNLTTYIIF